MLNRPRNFQTTLKVLTALSLLLGSVIISPPTPAYAASIVVNSNADDTLTNLDANLTCDLREAMVNANNDAATWTDCPAGSSTETISFATNYTITLVAELPAVSTTITINGNGAANTILQANIVANTATYRVLDVSASGNLTLNNLTVQNGLCASACAVITYRGGGILNAGTLAINNSLVISNKTPSGDGGGLYNNGGTVTINASTFSDNSSHSSGGAIANTSGTMTISNSTITNNNATSTNGGGLYNGGTMNIYNSTISGNIAGSGMSGDNIFQSPGTLNLYNTIVANHSATGGDCYIGSGTVNATNSLIESTGVDACGLVNGSNGNIIGSDPALGSLIGSPEYFLLNIGSPARDAGDDTICAATPVSNTSQNGATRPQGTHCDIGSYEASPIFTDVPYSYWANSYIERLYQANITSGCSVSPLNYCPDNTVTRDQMAIFLERGIHGSSFVPPNVAPTFGDTAGNFAEDWIEALKNDGITSGCGIGIYCPTSGVTRAQMAVFLERAMHGSSFVPPNVTPTFGDTAGNFAEDWIEALKNDAITSGCGGGNFCPDDVVTRAQMAIFLVKAFGLP